MKKLYRNHVWISLPDKAGLSFFGLSEFAKEHFLRLKRLDYEEYFKTKYGMKYTFKNQLFLERIQGRAWSELKLSEQMEYDRFAIRQDEPFCQLLTAEFDVELSAPIQMRIIKENYDVFFRQRLYQEAWLFQVQILKKEQMNELLDQDEYQKKKKFLTSV